jgi:hypothetical protein
MKLNFRALTREQRIAVLKDCAESPLSVREYAALKNLGYSTLTRWASREGISLTRGKEENPSGLQDPLSLTDKSAIAHKDTGSFSFIDVTSHAKNRNSFSPTMSPPSQKPGNFQLPETNLSSCVIEIRLPNGVMLKVEQVPSHDFWSQAVGFVQAFA